MLERLALYPKFIRLLTELFSPTENTAAQAISQMFVNNEIALSDQLLFAQEFLCTTPTPLGDEIISHLAHFCSHDTSFLQLAVAYYQQTAEAKLLQKYQDNLAVALFNAELQKKLVTTDDIVAWLFEKLSLAGEKLLAPIQKELDSYLRALCEPVKTKAIVAQLKVYYASPVSIVKNTARECLQKWTVGLSLNLATQNYFAASTPTQKIVPEAKEASPAPGKMV